MWRRWQTVGERGSILALLILAAGCGKPQTPAGGGGSAPGGQAAVSPPASGTEKKDPITLAVAGPMTGGGAAFGEMIRMAAELKVKQANEAGGVAGRKVKIQLEDDKSLASEATSVSRKLAGDPEVVAVIGHFNSDCSLAAKPEYNRVGVLQLSPGSTNVDVCRGGEWTFRNLYRDDQQGTFLARFARQALELKKVAVIYESDNYGSGLKKAFVEEAPKIGLDIATEETYQRGRTQDFKPHMTKIKAAGADGVFISGLFPEAALIIKTAKNDLGMDVPFFGGDGLSSDDLIRLGGKAVNGTYITTPFLFGTGKESAEAQQFYESFKAMHGKEPDTWAALTYDACGQVLEAVRSVGAERRAIRDFLAAQTSKEKGYAGVTGVTYFDEEGDCVGKPIYVTQVVGGKFIVSPRQLLE
ncbi:MAG: ABC transporter substrate-binding protein [Planctomycetes bacterium]|nr:ABC transporter substrate-binding protein [Planctomycetota bacterium]